MNITIELLEVIFYLNEHDGATQQEMADVLIRDKSGMAYLVDNLAKRAMVERREDEQDHRRKQIFLTAAGSGCRTTWTRGS